MSRHTRRSILAATATAVALAGCSQGQSNSDDTDDSTDADDQEQTTESPDVFAGVESDAGDNAAIFRVSLTEDADVGKIALVDSNGVQQKQQSVGATASAVEFQLFDDFEAGEYELVATRDGNEIAQKSVEIERSLKIENLEITGDEVARTFRVDVTNTGDLSSYFDSFAASGDLPEPTDMPSSPAIISGDVSTIDPLRPGESAVLQVRSEVLLSGSFAEEDLEKTGCTGQERTATLKLMTKSGLTKSIDVLFALSGSVEGVALGTNDGCSSWNLKSWSVAEGSGE